MIAPEELKKMDIGKLNEEATKLRNELFKIQFEIRNGEEKNNRKRKLYRKQIARIETLINQKNEN